MNFQNKIGGIFTGIKNLAGRAYKHFTAAMKEKIYSLLLLFVLFYAADFYILDIVSSADLFLQSFLLATLFSYISYIIRNRFLRGLYNTFLFASAVLMFVVEMFCVIVYGVRINVEFAGIIMGTNLYESYEFLTFYFSDSMLIGGVVLIVLAIALAVKYFNRIPKINNRHIYRCMALLFAAGCVSSVINSDVWKEVYLGKINLFAQVEDIPDLRNYLSNPNLNIEDNKQPQNVVVIIGESFTRRNSSLYGYEKQTNPRIGEHLGTPNLAVYNNVSSVAISTVATFSCLLSQYKSNSYYGKEWHLCPTLIEVVSMAGYNTYWVSNQSKSGVADNLVTRYAELCDVMEYTNPKNVGMHHLSYDEEVLPLLRNVKSSASGDKNFYFVHLMGSHYRFDLRYPDSYRVFKESDYKQFIESQRENRAHYDNSILYNDYVVSEIIKEFVDKESLVFYFSDHAIDLYCSSDDYAGHSKPSDQVSFECGKEIPFIIYMSDKYIEKYPEEAERIRAYVDREFSTNEFMISLMDIIGIKFADTYDAYFYSLFRKNE